MKEQVNLIFNKLNLCQLLMPYQDLHNIAIGGSKEGTGDMCPSPCISFQFHVVFGENGQNNRLMIVSSKFRNCHRSHLPP